MLGYLTQSALKKIVGRPSQIISKEQGDHIQADLIQVACIQMIGSFKDIKQCFVFHILY